MSDPGPRYALQEIRGPSALGGGARRFFDLLWLSAVTEFKLGYHGTVLGFLWSFLRPLLLFGVLLLVFTQVFRIGSQVVNYAPMLLLNILLFDFFSQTTQQASTSVVSNESVVRKMQFPRLVIPLSVVLTNAFHTGLSLIVVFIFLLVYGVDPVWTWIFLPVILGALALLTTGCALLLSAAYVRIRDIGIIWAVASTVLFYAAPILYPITSAPQAFQDLISLNPLTPLFNQIREWIIDPNAPGAVEATAGQPLLLVVPLLISGVVCVAGPIVFHRMAPRVAEEL
jgi:ABC-2 type transport system permease protein